MEGMISIGDAKKVAMEALHMAMKTSLLAPGDECTEAHSSEQRGAATITRSSCLTYFF